MESTILIPFTKDYLQNHKSKIFEDCTRVPESISKLLDKSIITEIEISKLKQLIGLDLNETKDFFIRNYKFTSYTPQIRGYQVQWLLSLILNEKFIFNRIGRDFKNFELKTVKCHQNKRGEWIPNGDIRITHLSDLVNKFENSLTYDKVSSLLFILVDDNNKIVSIRYFNGMEIRDNLINEYHIMCNSYKKFGKYRSHRDAKQFILCLKPKQNNISFKQNSFNENTIKLF